MKNLTILIPTHERSSVLFRAIEYYSSFQDIRIIILDSSKNTLSVNLPNNCSYLHLPNVSFGEKLNMGASMVDTEFVVVSADDDFLIAEGF